MATVWHIYSIGYGAMMVLTTMLLYSYCVLYIYAYMCRPYALFLGPGRWPVFRCTVSYVLYIYIYIYIY